MPAYSHDDRRGKQTMRGVYLHVGLGDVAEVHARIKVGGVEQRGHARGVHGPHKGHKLVIRRMY
jgi:hypothetical protein